MTPGAAGLDSQEAPLRRRSFLFSLMWMTDYTREIQRQLITEYGFDRNSDGYPQNVPNGAYPMVIEKKLDLVLVVEGSISCCNFITDKGGLKAFQKNDIKRRRQS